MEGSGGSHRYLNALQQNQESNNDALDLALADLDMMLDNQGLNSQLAEDIDIAQELFATYLQFVPASKVKVWPAAAAAAAMVAIISSPSEVVCGGERGAAALIGDNRIWYIGRTISPIEISTRVTFLAGGTIFVPSRLLGLRHSSDAAPSRSA